MELSRFTLSTSALILSPLLLSCCGAAGAQKRSKAWVELVRDLLGEAVLDLVAFEHVDELAVFEEGDLGRRGRVGREVLARRGRGLDVGAGEDGDGAVGLRLVLERHRDAGARLARRAAADGVDDDEQRALRVR